MRDEAPRISIKKLRPDAQVPRAMSAGAAGLDLAAALDAPLSILPGDRALVPTGLAMAIPPGWEGQVRPRSGLAIKFGVTCLNAPGTIDADYRGEVKVILINHGREPFVVHPGDRIAQLVIAAVAPAVTVEVDELPATERGAGGFGSTGGKREGGGA
jgi:dUTP pyrophosphatase